MKKEEAARSGPDQHRVWSVDQVLKWRQDLLVKLLFEGVDLKGRMGYQRGYIMDKKGQQKTQKEKRARNRELEVRWELTKEDKRFLKSCNISPK